MFSLSFVFYFLRLAYTNSLFPLLGTIDFLWLAYANLLFLPYGTTDFFWLAYTNSLFPLLGTIDFFRLAYTNSLFLPYGTIFSPRLAYTNPLFPLQGTIPPPRPGIPQLAFSPTGYENPQTAGEAYAKKQVLVCELCRISERGGNRAFWRAKKKELLYRVRGRAPYPVIRIFENQKNYDYSSISTVILSRCQMSSTYS